MRLFGNPISPNYLRVAILAREKGISLDRVDPSAVSNYESINPLGQVPSLELDDGTALTESLVIARYLDEISGPEFLFGSTREERALIGMWERRAETLIFNAAVEFGHHTHPFFANYFNQHPDWARDLLPGARKMSQLADDQLASNAYLAGGHFSVADITLYLGWFLMDAYGALPWNESRQVSDWRSRLEKRNSFTELEFLRSVFQASANL